MSAYLTRHNILIAAILVGILMALFSHLQTVELRGEEPRRAIVAMEMNISGQYIVPKINGWNYYNKPPLFNWLLLSFFKMFGSYDAWVVRIPSLLALLLTGLLHYFFVKKYLSKEVALLSSLLFLTSGDIFFYGTQLSGEIDLFFTLLVYTQVILIFHFTERKDYLTLFITTYTLAALGVLTKGLPSIVFQCITLVAWLAYKRDLRMLFHWKHLAGIICFALITTSYFWAYARQADVIPYLINLVKESSQRSAIESSFISLLLSALAYPLNVIKFLLPWSFFVGYLFSGKTWPSIKGNDFLVFCTLFILANIPLYWFTADPKSRYIYMFFPFILVLLTWFRQEREHTLTGTTRMINILLTIIIFLVPLSGLVIPWIVDQALIPNAFLKGLCISLISGGVAWFFIRDKTSYRIYYVVLCLVIARIAVNVFYLPTLNQKTRALTNLHHVENLYALTEGAGFSLAGKPYTQNTNLPLGPMNEIHSGIRTAPLLSYSIPYYYTKKTNQILRFEENMRPGNYYLIYLHEIGHYHVDTLYTFQETGTKDDMGLVRLKP